MRETSGGAARTMGEPTPAQRLLARSVDWGRAPSAHNTQPWDVRADGDRTLTLGWRPERTLPVGDPTARDLLLSLGCVAETLAITAADLGYAVRVRWSVDRRRAVAGHLELEPGPAAAKTDFTVAEVRARRTARGAYEDPALSAAQVRQLTSDVGLPDDVGLPGGVDLVTVPSAVVDRALPIADRWSFDGPATGELREWLRLDRRATAYRQDGLTDLALGLSRAEALGLRWALRPRVLGVLRRTRATRLLAATATARPLGTVVALTTRDAPDDEQTAVLGRWLLRSWLAASRRGWSTHPLSHLLDAPESAALMHDAAAGVPVAVFRVGVPAQPAAASHRLSDPSAD
ncbi:MAG: hypothetical protein ACR2FV_14795 [Ornithinimicrobium sp.]|uniref:hypothetical protein n=1 Tax=Ornithinimicrobium sp. TaxID=1977084 RepID=UPI003D9B114C